MGAHANISFAARTPEFLLVYSYSIVYLKLFLFVLNDLYEHQHAVNRSQINECLDIQMYLPCYFIKSK